MSQDQPEILITATRPWEDSEFSLVRVFFDGAMISGVLALTPEEARTMGVVMELGAKEAGVSFEYVEETYKEV